MFENPYGVPHEEIIAMLLELPSEMAAQVIFGKYVESSGLVFTGELIQQLIDRTAKHYSLAWDREYRITGDRWHFGESVELAKQTPWEVRRHRYAGGVDFARQTDFTVISVLDVSYFPARLVYYRRLNRVPWDSIYREIGRAVSVFGPSWLGDQTGMAGDVIFENLEDTTYCLQHDRVFRREAQGCRDKDGERLSCRESVHNEFGEKVRNYFPLACVDGYVFSQNSKKNLIEHLRNLMGIGYQSGSDIPFGRLRVPPIVQIEEEASFYAWDDKGLDTDTIMSLALAAWQGLEDQPGAPSPGSIHGR
jgi:hypothetical protein